MRTLFIRGTTIANWRGAEVWKNEDNKRWRNITNSWSWSESEHVHREVAKFDDGSYWVPTATNAPGTWTAEEVRRASDHKRISDPNDEYRPSGTYIWIPEQSITESRYVPGVGGVDVWCSAPKEHPPQPQ